MNKFVYRILLFGAISLLMTSCIKNLFRPRCPMESCRTQFIHKHAVIVRSITPEEARSKYADRAAATEGGGGGTGDSTKKEPIDGDVKFITRRHKVIKVESTNTPQEPDTNASMSHIKHRHDGERTERKGKKMKRFRRPGTDSWLQKIFKKKAKNSGMGGEQKKVKWYRSRVVPWYRKQQNPKIGEHWGKKRW